MEIIHSNGKFKIESSSQKGKFYAIDPDKPFCNCPQFMYREMRRSGVCKHITSVREYREQQGIAMRVHPCSEKNSNNVVAYVRQKESIGAIELIEKFGEETINALIRRGMLIEEKGKIRCLE